MKKAILIVFATLSLISCMGTKKVTETKQTTKETTSVEKSSDSSSTVKINKAVDDKVSTKVEKTGDPFLDAKIDEILNKINTSKSSGANSYNLYFNKKTRELIAELKMGQTQDSISSTKNSLKSESSFENEIESYVFKKIRAIPWWIWALLVWMLRKPIWWILVQLLPFLKGITVIHKFITGKDANNKV